MDYNIGDRIVDDKRDLTITDKKYFMQGNRKAWYYKYHCNKCGYDCQGGFRGGEFKEATWFSKDQLGRRKSSCPCCISKIIVPHINSIYATHPELSKYFLNDDDKKYSVYSGVKVNLVCPFCGTIKKNMTISSLYRQGIACPICSGKISIGERMMYCVLTRLGVKFKKEFMFPNNQWRYDFYISEHNAIIEIHGEQHYKQTTFGVLSVVQQNDINKMNFALDKGIEKYIVINAMKSDYDYIANSIINSDFAKIYDLSLIDWSEIRKTIYNHNIVKDVCLYWEEHKNVTYADMERLFNFSEATIRKYLKTGYALGWCQKDNRNIDCINGAFNSHNHNDSHPILYTPKNIYFKSIGLCSRLSENVLGQRIASSTIRYKINRDSVDFKYISKTEFNEAFNSDKKCYGIPFSEDLLLTS